MSVETITALISAAGLLSGFVAAFAWIIRRSDTQLEGLETRLGDRITGVETRLGDRITGAETALGDRISGVERELVEVKIAIARNEGPPRHLVTAR